MAFTVDGPAEAYAAVALLIVGADGVGTLPERDFLWGPLNAAPVFDEHDAESLGALLGTIAGRMFSDLPNDDVGPTADGVSQLCEAVGEALGEAECSEVFALAVDLACADGLDDREHAVLTQVAEELGLDAESAEALIAEKGG